MSNFCPKHFFSSNAFFSFADEIDKRNLPSKAADAISLLQLNISPCSLELIAHMTVIVRMRSEPMGSTYR
jgi:hypothetical protein